MIYKEKRKKLNHRRGFGISAFLFTLCRRSSTELLGKTQELTKLLVCMVRKHVASSGLLEVERGVELPPYHLNTNK